MKITKKKIILDDYCKCQKPIIATKNTMFGYQEYCTKCGKNIEGGLHYDNEPLD